jgi:hypothetical protein
MKTEADQLLLDCLRQDGRGVPVERLAALTGEGWESLLQAAGRHSLTPLLYHTLKPVMGAANAPPAIQASLRTSYLGSAARNMRLYHELGQVLAAFREAAIPVILLKGAYLAKFVYGNIALRPMSDIDLLIKPADIPRVWNVLAGLGYVTAREDVGQSREHLSPFTKEGCASIEVHFSITDPAFGARCDVDSLFARALPVILDDVDALTL